MINLQLRSDRSSDISSDQVVFMERLSHDMRSLLASILGYATLVAEADLRPPESSLETYGQVIVKQTLRLQKLIDDALTVSRIVENQLDWEFRPIRLGSILSAVVMETREQTGREICFRDEVGEYSVAVDSLHLIEAFSKLLENAVRFSSPTSPIEVNLVRGETGRELEIRIIDHGIGIAEADLPRLFRPFGRINHPQARAVTGAGLGLFIANEIVKKHSGEILVRSQSGQGSIFTIRLPLTEETDRTEWGAR